MDLNAKFAEYKAAMMRIAAGSTETLDGEAADGSHVLHLFGDLDDEIRLLESELENRLSLRRNQQTTRAIDAFGINKPSKRKSKGCAGEGGDLAT